MIWEDFNHELASKLRGNSALGDERPIIYIDIANQRIHWIDIEVEDCRSYPVSTALNGLGNRIESYKTPFGIHRIRQKIGGGELAGTVFEGREPVDRIARNMDIQDADEITSRILWLDGMEEGVNRGGVYDTYSRYIYIHGTSDEKRIGQPVSAGCIRMKNDDVIKLFDDVLVNDLVLIR